MATQQEVEQFLQQFKVKLEIFGIIFRDDRGKNQQTLFDLGISVLERLQVVMQLEFTDYSQGPIVDTLNHGTDMWVFGKDVKGQEVYIKVTMGFPNSNTICISFHIAEHPLSYPFKN